MRTITFAFLATFVGTTLGGPLEDADTASKQGDYEGALRLIRPLAEQGNAKAQKSLGDMYLDGHGVAPDDVEAVKWYRMAADQGYAEAQLKLGTMYYRGQGVPLGDCTVAAEWYGKAAEQGNATAQYNLGAMHRRVGCGISRDDAVAAKWYRKAAEQGHAAAQYAVAVMYANGQGVAQDDAEAAKWYRKSAEQGNARAQNYVGVLYRDGRGVRKDDAEAVAWFRKAAEQGYAEGQNNLGFMLENGRGVAKSDTEAAEWYRKAVSQGNALAQVNLGRLAKKGRAALTPSDCKLVKIDQWLVRFSRNRWLVIDGAINGQKVGILLDTGAMRTMLFRPVAERLGLMMQPIRNAYASGVGGISFIESAHVGEFKIGESTRRNWYMMVAGEHDPGDGIGVVLGEDFFQNVDVEFDLANRAVRLFQPGICKGVSLAYWAADGAQEVEFESIDADRPRILVPVKVNGFPIAALFDTGATVSSLNKTVAGRLGVRPDTPGVVAAGKFVGIGSESTDVWIGPFESFEIGGEAIRTTSIPFGDTPNGTQMVLGMDFLLAHRLLVSHSQRKIYFTYTGGPVFQRSDAAQRGKD